MRKNGSIFVMLLYLLITLVISIKLNSITVFFLSLIFSVLLIVIYRIFVGNNVKIFITSFLFMCLGIVYAYSVYEVYEYENGIPYYTSYYNDDQKFEMIAKDYYESGLNIFEYTKDNRYVPNLQYGFYIFTLGKLYLVGDFFDGFHTFGVKVFHIFVLALSLLILMNFLVRRSNLPKKFINMFVVLFFLTPNMLYISSFTFRDVLGILLCVLFYVISDTIINKIKEKKFPGLEIFSGLLLLFLQYNLREIVAFVMALYLYILLLFAIKNLRFKIIIIIIGVAASIPLFGLIMSFINLTDSYVNTYSEYRNSSSGGLEGIIKNTPLLPFGIFIRGIYGFFHPSPGFGYLFDETSFGYNLINTFNGLGTILILILVPLFILGAKNNKGLLLYWILLYCIYLTSLTFRHIVLMYPFLLLLIAFGAYEYNKIRTKRSTIIYLIYITIIIGTFTIFSLMNLN